MIQIPCPVSLPAPCTDTKVDLRILLPIPACNLSPLCLNMYMTPAQLAAATIANGIGAIGIGPGLAALLVNGGSGCSRGENGSAGGFGVVEYSRGRRETRVRDKTYRTICSFIYFVSTVHVRVKQGHRDIEMDIPLYVPRKPTNPPIHQQSNYPNPSLSHHSSFSEATRILYIS